MSENIFIDTCYTDIKKLNKQIQEIYFLEQIEEAKVFENRLNKIKEMYRKICNNTNVDIRIIGPVVQEISKLEFDIQIYMKEIGEKIQKQKREKMLIEETENTIINIEEKETEQLWQDLRKIVQKWRKYEHNNFEEYEGKKKIAKVALKIYKSQIEKNETIDFVHIQEHCDEDSFLDIIKEELIKIAEKEEKREVLALGRDLTVESLVNEKLWSVLTGKKIQQLEIRKNEIEKIEHKQEIHPIEKEEVVKIEESKPTISKKLIKKVNKTINTAFFNLKSILTLSDTDVKWEEEEAINDGNWGPYNIKYTYADINEETGKYENIRVEYRKLENGDYNFSKYDEFHIRKIEMKTDKVYYYPFKHLYNLQEVYLYDDVKEIQKNSKERVCFQDCHRMKKIRISNKITDIPDECFVDCWYLEKIEIPDSVKEIGAGAFRKCRSLKEIKLGNQIEAIGRYCFEECKNLEKIEIPDSVKEIGAGAFRKCISLKKISLGNQVESIEYSCFEECENLEKIEIPDRVKEIGRDAFGKCISLKEISLGNQVESIEYSCFEECENLEKIKIPDSVKEIGGRSFRKCISLKEISLGNQVENISLCCFEECKNLEKIEIPENVRKIEKEAFLACSSLKEIRLNNQIQTIEYSCFAGCEKLEKIEIPDSVKKIGAGAFYGCISLKEISLGNQIQTIAYRCFEECENLEKIEIPDSVKEIGAGVFRKCISLKEISLGNQVENISLCCFEECENLEKIEIPDSVKEIGAGAFFKCSSLKEIRMGKNTKFTENYYMNDIKSIKYKNGVAYPKGLFSLERIELVDEKGNIEVIDVKENNREEKQEVFEL